MKRSKKALSMVMVLVMLVAVFIAAPSVGKAASTYYVSTAGSDSNPGTISQPFRTIQKGVTTARAGDTVYIRGGFLRHMAAGPEHYLQQFGRCVQHLCQYPYRQRGGCMHSNTDP